MFDTSIDLTFEGCRKRAGTTRLFALVEMAWFTTADGNTGVRAVLLQSDSLLDLARQWMREWRQILAEFNRNPPPYVVESAVIDVNPITGNQRGNSDGGWQVIINLVGGSHTGFKCYISSPAVVNAKRGQYFDDSERDVMDKLTCA